MQASRRLRILHAPTDVGNPWVVSQALRQLGHRSDVLVYTQHYGFRSDYNLHFESKSKIKRLWAAICFFIPALWRYDIFHFYFSTTFFPLFLDLPILRLLKKKIFVTFQGCDLRPAADCPSAVADPAHHRHASLSVQQRQYRTLVRYANKTYVSTPDLIRYSPQSTLLPPITLNLDEWPPQYSTYQQGRDVVLFHAPTDPIIKGTKYVEAAVKQLQSEGRPIKLDRPAGISHQELYQRAARADLALDQLIVGWYGGIGVEMMALGKPLICYIKSEYRSTLPADIDFPVVNGSVDGLTDILRNLLDDPETWIEIGRRGRHFVEEYYRPARWAASLIHDYQSA